MIIQFIDQSVPINKIDGMGHSSNLQLVSLWSRLKERNMAGFRKK